MLPYKNPLAYKQLRTWQQANEILELTEEFCATFALKDARTGQYLSDLKDQMLRSGRSVVRNIEEGFARTTTKEYISFLGFSRGSLEELLRDFEHCIAKGVKGDAGIGEQKLAEKGFWLCKGEAKMLFNQIKSLERKMINEKTLPAQENARQAIMEAKRKNDEFDKYLQSVLDKNKQNIKPLNTL